MQKLILKGMEKNILANDIKQLHKISVNFTYKEYFKDGNPKSD